MTIRCLMTSVVHGQHNTTPLPPQQRRLAPKMTKCEVWTLAHLPTYVSVRPLGVHVLLQMDGGAAVADHFLGGEPVPLERFPRPPQAGLDFLAGLMDFAAFSKQYLQHVPTQLEQARLRYKGCSLAVRPYSLEAQGPLPCSLHLRPPPSFRQTCLVNQPPRLQERRGTFSTRHRGSPLGLPMPHKVAPGTIKLSPRTPNSLHVRPKLGRPARKTEPPAICSAVPQYDTDYA
jgi:hypothetical protein